MEMLTNKNVLIVGATGGIGCESTRMIKGNQANIFITGRDKQKLQQVAQDNEIPEDQVFELDVTQSDQVEKVAQAIHQKVERVDVLVNAAGIGILKPLEKLENQDFDRVIDINLKGTFYLLRAFLPPMKQAKKGMIINLPGVLGKVPMAGASAYAAHAHRSAHRQFIPGRCRFPLLGQHRYEGQSR